MTGWVESNRPAAVLVRGDGIDIDPELLIRPDTVATFDHGRRRIPITVRLDADSELDRRWFPDVRLPGCVEWLTAAIERYRPALVRLDGRDRLQSVLSDGALRQFEERLAAAVRANAGTIVADACPDETAPVDPYERLIDCS